MAVASPRPVPPIALGAVHGVAARPDEQGEAALQVSSSPSLPFLTPRDSQAELWGLASTLPFVTGGF